MQECGGDYSDAHLAEGIGISATIGAVVFGGAAVAHFLTARSGDEQSARNATSSDFGWNASCMPGLLGISCGGRF
jgi:hypothetical protein